MVAVGGFLVDHGVVGFVVAGRLEFVELFVVSGFGLWLFCLICGDFGFGGFSFGSCCGGDLHLRLLGCCRCCGLVVVGSLICGSCLISG